MKNPVEKAYLTVAGIATLYVIGAIGCVAIWTTGVLIGWNGFISYVFHLPTVNFWQSLACVLLFNFLLAPWYALQQTKDTNKR